MATKRKASKQKVIKLIRKSNSIVEAHYRFSIWEQRIFTAMLTKINFDDEDFKKYRIYLIDVMKDNGVENSRSSYDRLRKGAADLMRKTVKFTNVIDGELFETTAPLVIWIDRPLEEERREDARFIDISFHPDMKPHLLSLKGEYLSYDATNTNNLSSFYHVRLYEILKQYERIGKRTITVEELKKKLGVIEEILHAGKVEYYDYMPKYSAFRTKVLLKAQKALAKNTDISFTFKGLKRGRSYYAIEFTIISQPKALTVVEETIAPLPYAEIEEVYETVKHHLSKEQIINWVETYDFQSVSAAIAYTRQQILRGNRIMNVGGYVATLLQNQGFTVANPKEEVAESDAQKTIRQQKEALEKQFALLAVQIKGEEILAIQAFIQQHPVLVEEIPKIMQEHKLSRYDHTKSYTDNLLTNSFFKTYLTAWMKRHYPESVAAVDYTPINALEKSLASLV